MFKPTGFSEQIFKDRYAFTEEETWEEACKRVAKQTAMAESPDKVKKYEEKFYEVLSNNYFCPGGRIWYGSGRPSPNLLNCFVLETSDSKEGWAKLSHDFILTSMQGGGCGVDLSPIRPLGASIKGQTGTCPGPICLAELINGNGHPVRAGNSRRAACLMGLELQHPDIEKFIEYKIQKGKLDLTNISIKSTDTKSFIKAVKNDEMWNLHWKGQYKKEVSAKDLWNKIVTNTYNCAEPGFLNWELVESENTINYSSKLTITNPCQPKFAKVLTPEGIKTFKDIKIGSIIWSGKNWTKVVNKVCTGIKPVYKYSTTTGNFIGTENHKILQNGHKIQVKDAENIDWNVCDNIKTFNINDLKAQDIMDGVVLGDGSVHKASNNLVHLYIGKNDNSYFDSEIANLIKKYRPRISKYVYEITTTILHDEILLTYDRVIPDRFYYSDVITKAGFLRGLFTANGSISGKRVTLKQSSYQLIEQVQEMLSSLGIHSYITFNKSKKIKFSNGEYQCRKSYDLNITSGRDRFKKMIGFIQPYKQNTIIKSRKPKILTSKIKHTEFLGNEEVFSITVEDKEHTYWTGGCLVGNCGEIPINSMGSCCLGHLVLPKFVQNEDIDWHLLGNTIRLGIRFLDNILDVNIYPLPQMKEIAEKYRRVGLGTTGLADTLVMLNLQYGSEEANKFVNKLYRFISKASYEASIMLSVEKGPFPACNFEKHTQTGYVSRMTNKIKSLIEEHGIRNCALLTVAPTGTASILSGNCSSGIEPMFAPAYERRYWKEDKRKTELVFHPLFAQYMKENKSVKHFVSARDLSVRDHLEVQKIVQKHIDNAVSKTINIPENYPVEELSETWLEYLPYLKGTTFYRENTRGYVDEDGNIQEPPLKAISLVEAKKRFTKEAKAVIIPNDCKSGSCDL